MHPFGIKMRVGNLHKSNSHVNHDQKFTGLQIQSNTFKPTALTKVLSINKKVRVCGNIE